MLRNFEISGYLTLGVIYW